MTATKDDGTVEAPRPLITVAQLAKIATRCDAQVWAPLLSAAMRAAGILSVNQRSQFLANVLHESGEFRFQREVWAPTRVQLEYERNRDAAWPPHPGDERNERAWKLGNSEPNDGFVFRGTGPMQCTGRLNLLHASRRLYGDDRLVTNPALLDDRLVGIELATDFWRVGAGGNLTDHARSLGAHDGCDLNDYCGSPNATPLIRACINGGRNGLEQVAAYQRAAGAVLG